MVLLPLIRDHVDVPIIAAGGISDGRTMAAAFALGAEGVQMGTQMLSCLESPVHINWKESIVNARETDTVFLNQKHSPALRALRTDRSERLADMEENIFRAIRRPTEAIFRWRYECRYCFKRSSRGKN